MYLVFKNWTFKGARIFESEAIESILDEGLDSMDYPFDLYVVVNAWGRNYFKVVLAGSILEPKLTEYILTERDKLVEYGMQKVAQIKARTT